ncbi:hypothetical protein EI28_05435 [Methanoculleus sp. MH98A]|nr:hypothetical protein EI28_05435 [Methanoculleus sp. MH98A]
MGLIIFTGQARVNEPGMHGMMSGPGTVECQCLYSLQGTDILGEELLNVADILPEQVVDPVVVTPNGARTPTQRASFFEA